MNARSPATDTRVPVPEAPAPHQVALAGGRYVMWQDFVLRSAGMPVSWLEDLAEPTLADLDQAEMGQDAAGRHEDAALAVSARVQRLAGHPAVRTAITLQNPRLAANFLDAFLGSPVPAHRNRRWRERVLVLSRYLQRYCAKNDTIGFFGPVAWGQVSSGASIRVRSGVALIRSLDVHFENWAMDEVAAALVERHRLRPWLAPRRNPSVEVHGGVALAPYRTPVELPALPAALLAAADGSRDADELAGDAAWLGLVDPDDEQAVPAALADLARRRLLHWDLRLPLGAWPDRELSARLEAVGEPGRRRAAAADLAPLLRARDEVRRTAADLRPVELAAAIAELDGTFTELTGRPPHRRDGEPAAGRTLVYADSRRDVDVQLGADVLTAIGPALSLVLDSARWYTAEVAAGYRLLLADLHEQARRRAPDEPVSLSTLTFLLGPHLVGHRGTIVESAAGALRARWDRLLGAPTGGTAVSHRSADLAGAVASQFRCSGPGWTAARYHSPDLLLAAGSASAVSAGATPVVLGELHVAVNTLENRVFCTQHPDPDRLLANVARDGVGHRIVPMLPKDWREVTPRTYPPSALLSPSYDYWSIGDDDGGAPVSVYPAAGLTVLRGTDGLRVRSIDGRLDADLVEVIGELLSMVCVNGFGMVEPRPHTPRVSIDSLVVAREAWRVPAAEFRIGAAGELAEFLAVRRLATALGLPRRVFVQAPGEPKPCYVDLLSPPLTQLLVRIAGRAGDEDQLTFSEMLPGPESAWLADTAGDRYVSELRLVAVERRTPGPAATVEGKTE